MKRLMKILSSLFQSENNKSDNDVVENKQPIITYGEYYCETICPKCKELLDERKARYSTKCCYKCGFRNESLFYAENRLVREKYINGKFVEKEIVNQ